MNLNTLHVYWLMAFLLFFNFAFSDYSNYYIDQYLTHPKGTLIDYLHILTSPINLWMITHPPVSRILLIIQSLCCDSVITIMTLSIIVNKQIYPLFATIVIIFLRQTMLTLFRLPIPENMIWYDPGIPSLSVTYSQSDFYFSGHTSTFTFFLLYCFIYEWENTKIQKIAQKFAIVSLIYIISLLIVFRIHYTADIFTGFIFTLLIFFTSRYYEIKNKTDMEPLKFITQPLFQE
jgi:hypothetical protein